MSRFERRHEPLLPFRRYLGRQGLYLLFSAGILALSLYGGMAGFHYLEKLSWLDSLLNATMLLGGEGPLAQPRSTGGKLFASFYAVYSGVVFLVAFGLLITPLAHRLFHRFHLGAEDVEARSRRTSRKR